MSFNKIHNKARAKQIVNFNSLQWRNGICPTDIDGVLDFRGKLFIYFELKTKSAPMPKGQRRHFEYICNALRSANIPAYAIVAEHDTKPNDEISAPETIVREYYNGVSWLTPESPETTLKSAIESLLEHHDIYNIIKGLR